jgi:hypothetical protein
MRSFHQKPYELRTDIRVDLFRHANKLFSEYGFAVPYMMDFGYDIDNQHVLMHMRYGAWNTTYVLPKLSDGVFSFTGAIESMCLDARVPIAEPL